MLIHSAMAEAEALFPHRKYKGKNLPTASLFKIPLRFAL